MTLQHEEDSARDRTSAVFSRPRETASEAETRALGAELAPRLSPGDVVALYGDLGAGKTQLVKGICAALGVDPTLVSSPTFTIVQEYAGHTGPLYHIDAYRIADPAEFFELGYEEYFYGEGLCFVEWPERVEALLPPHTLRLRLTHAGGDRRRIEPMAPPR
ncbi:MAG: tRNA (adenosine(37)-N6)-threonylcarbamoyltransferase complex ATPase subunit type 1 TsaE [Bacteroidetes bacterium]|nr:tRNA (adenosine(37)-N6)-threonylcarbamoyltransferase complex ATPase subunit type 1 TsaE [Rhodothermaceae bacterium RA]RMH68917.1 MAG: tRNA (adenosine(37)-N6)-threonylcarbamoyltransferase complex ATPase subunit type 1 TsaE [Bacteroidota bacterium]